MVAGTKNCFGTMQSNGNGRSQKRAAEQLLLDSRKCRSGKIWEFDDVEWAGLSFERPQSRHQLKGCSMPFGVERVRIRIKNVFIGGLRAPVIYSIELAIWKEAREY